MIYFRCDCAGAIVFETVDDPKLKVTRCVTLDAANGICEGDGTLPTLLAWISDCVGLADMIEGSVAVTSNPQDLKEYLISTILTRTDDEGYATQHKPEEFINLQSGVQNNEST